MHFRKKVLTLESVIDIIVLTPIPAGEDSADDAILARIQSHIDAGYTLTEEAEREVAKHFYNAVPLLKAAE